jgi:hypothetical protein
MMDKEINAEERKKDIGALLCCADDSRYSDVKEHYQLKAIAYSLMWIAEELHEVNERCKDGY